MMTPPSTNIRAQAARDYRTQRHSNQNERRASATPIEQNARLGFVFDQMGEVNRLSVAVLVALGAEDFDLAHECLGALVTDLRNGLKSWEAFRSANHAGAP